MRHRSVQFGRKDPVSSELLIPGKISDCCGSNPGAIFVLSSGLKELMRREEESRAASRTQVGFDSYPAHFLLCFELNLLC